MKNITLSIDEKLLMESRKYASKNNLSLNQMIRQLLKEHTSRQSTNWIKECFQLMDQSKGNSKGEKWSREDLYAR